MITRRHKVRRPALAEEARSRDPQTSCHLCQGRFSRNFLKTFQRPLQIKGPLTGPWRAPLARPADVVDAGETSLAFPVT